VAHIRLVSYVFGLVSFAVVPNARHLAGCHKYQRTFLVVIGMPAIDHITIIYVLQKRGLEAEVHFFALAWACLRQIDEVYQGV